VNTVLVGNGYFGSLYRERLIANPNLTLVGLVDPNTDNLTDDVPVHALSLHQLIDNLDFDAVVIATPPQQHKELAVQAMRAGKDVMCAKPGSMSVDDMLEIGIVSVETGKCFYIDYTVLASAENNALDQLFALYGDLHTMRSQRYVKGAEKPEGIVFDLFCHDIALYWYHCLDDVTITSVVCEKQLDGSVRADLYCVDTIVASMVAAYDAPYARKTASFSLIPHKKITSPSISIEWSQTERRLLTSVQGKRSDLYFAAQPDPISLSIEKFVQQQTDMELYTYVVSVCEMLNESLSKDGARVEAP
jgi:predicted dehydrogenase